MVRHGNVAKVQFLSRYLLDCVQKHMDHHGDTYYNEGKSIRNRVDVFMGQVERRAARPITDDTVARLSEVHDALQIGLRPKAKALSTPLQPDLFAPATRRQRP